VDGRWIDNGGTFDPKIGSMERGRPEPYSFQFIANAGVVVHPDHEFCLLVGPSTSHQQKTKILKIVYRLFDENMLPKEGTIEL